MRIVISVRTVIDDPATEVMVKMDITEIDAQRPIMDFAKLFLIPAWVAIRSRRGSMAIQAALEQQPPALGEPWREQ